jgi:DNA-binding protein HU-beta
VTRRDQVDVVAETAKLTTEQARDALDAVAGVIAYGLLEDEQIKIERLGSFVVRRRGPRRVRNPATGVMMDVPATAVVLFRPVPQLRDRVKERHA